MPPISPEARSAAPITSRRICSSRCACKRVDQGRPDQRQHVLGGGGEAQGEVALGVARLHQGADDQLAVGLGDPRRPHPDRPRHLQHPLLGQAGVEEGLDAPRRLDVGVGERAARRGRGRGCRGAALKRCSSSRSMPGDLGDLARRVAGPVAGERPLDRQQRQPAGVDRFAQLLERDAFAGQLLEQLQPRLAGLALDAVEQPLCLEVDRPASPSPPFSWPQSALARRRRRGAGRRRR